MHFLNILTITAAGLMAGVEFAVSAFINPAVWRLESAPQLQLLSRLGRLLGRAMPVWYGFCLVLLGVESFLRRQEPALAALAIATALWTAAIVLSIAVLVPLNNRLVALNTAGPSSGWERDHRKWDGLHRVRVLLLTVAVVVLVSALAL